jgi:flagellar biosynthesis/type III secretory pathway M-ring protein FliF/YscJ
MELFRVTRNPWGQETLVGVSWDLLWWFVGAGAVFIVVHALWTGISRFRRRRHASADRQGAST